MKIPGLSFSWKRALGISQAKQKFARTTGIPTTKQGLERKVGSSILKAIFGKKRSGVQPHMLRKKCLDTSLGSCPSIVVLCGL